MTIAPDHASLTGRGADPPGIAAAAVGALLSGHGADMGTRR